MIPTINKIIDGLLLPNGAKEISAADLVAKLKEEGIMDARVEATNPGREATGRAMREFRDLKNARNELITALLDPT